jgi:drug/metabolite transporter (DMT)-like permease
VAVDGRVQDARADRMRPVRRHGVLIALLAVQVCFATAPVAVKLALRELSSPALAMLRVTAATVLFLLLHRAISDERIRERSDYVRLAAYALFGVVLNQLLYITALTHTTATAAQTLVTAGPAMTLLVAILLRRETATGGKWLGIGLAALGALYLVGVDWGGSAGTGNLLVLLNVLAFSIYLVISRDILKRYSPLTVVTWVFVFGTVGMAPVGAMAAFREAGDVSLTTWLVVAWIVVVPTVGAYYLNQWALQRVEASVVAVFTYLQPVGTAMLAIPLLGERPGWRLLPAAALIFLGVGIAARLGRRPAPPAV